MFKKFTNSKIYQIAYSAHINKYIINVKIHILYYSIINTQVRKKLFSDKTLPFMLNNPSVFTTHISIIRHENNCLLLIKQHRNNFLKLWPNTSINNRTYFSFLLNSNLASCINICWSLISKTFPKRESKR